MYPVSQAFLNAVKANSRKYYWTGKITTIAGTVYNFDQDDMVKGSGYHPCKKCHFGNARIANFTLQDRWAESWTFFIFHQ